MAQLEPIHPALRFTALLAGALVCATLADWSGRSSPAAWGLSGARTRLWNLDSATLISAGGALLVAVVAGGVVRWSGLGAGLLCLGLALLARVTGGTDTSAHGIQAAVLTGQTDVFLASSLMNGLAASLGMLLWLLAVQKSAGAHLSAGRPSALPVGLGNSVLISLIAAAVTTAVCVAVGWFGLVTTASGQIIGGLAIGYLFAGLAVRVVLPHAGLAPMLLGPVAAVMIASRLAVRAYGGETEFLEAWLNGAPPLRLATATPLQTLTAGLLGLGTAILLAGLLEPVNETHTNDNAAPKLSGSPQPSYKRQS